MNGKIVLILGWGGLLPLLHFSVYGTVDVMITPSYSIFLDCGSVIGSEVACVLAIYEIWKNVSYKQFPFVFASACEKDVPKTVGHFHGFHVW